MIGKEDVNLSLIKLNLAAWVENPKQSSTQELLELISEFKSLDTTSVYKIQLDFYVSAINKWKMK